MLTLSQVICKVTKHYVDGLFFGHIFSLLAVMMVYKYWDSITKEDLEFSVGGKLNVWEIKENSDQMGLLVTDARGVIPMNPEDKLGTGHDELLIPSLHHMPSATDSPRLGSATGSYRESKFMDTSGVGYNH